jgi:hypothetical protein
MTRRSWLYLLLLAVFIIAVIAIIRSGSSSSPDNVAVNAPESAGVQTIDEQTQTGEESGNESAAADSPPQTSSEVTGTVHFVDCAFRTGGNATIGVPLAITQEGGISLVPGDEIAIFTPDGAVCAGAAVWSGSNIAITAWGDDSQSEPIEGMQEGDEFLFRIWDESARQELAVSAVTYELGDGKYTIDGIFVVNSFRGG